MYVCVSENVGRAMEPHWSIYIQMQLKRNMHDYINTQKLSEIHWNSTKESTSNSLPFPPRSLNLKIISKKWEEHRLNISPVTSREAETGLTKKPSVLSVSNSRCYMGKYIFNVCVIACYWPDLFIMLLRIMYLKNTRSDSNGTWLTMGSSILEQKTLSMRQKMTLGYQYSNKFCTAKRSGRNAHILIILENQG